MRLGDLDALARVIKTECNPYGKPTIDFESGKRVLEIIDNTSPVEERPTGQWIIVGEEQGAFNITYKIRKCSNCGWEHSLVIPDNFCPKCGAIMKGNT